MEIESLNSLHETNDSSIEISFLDNFCLKTEDIISYISDYFNKMIEQNKNKKHDKKFNKNDIFYAKSIPNLSLDQYLFRIKKYSDIEDFTLISAFIFIKRFIEKNKYLILKNNIFKIILASCSISIKFIEDLNYKNSYIAKIGGISLKDMNAIEYNFYILINFDLHLNENDFKDIEVQFLLHKDK